MSLDEEQLGEEIRDARYETERDDCADFDGPDAWDGGPWRVGTAEGFGDLLVHHVREDDE